MKQIITVIVALMLLIGASALANADRAANGQPNTPAEVGYNYEIAE